MQYKVCTCMCMYVSRIVGKPIQNMKEPYIKFGISSQHSQRLL